MCAGEARLVFYRYGCHVRVWGHQAGLAACTVGDVALIESNNKPGGTSAHSADSVSGVASGRSGGGVASVIKMMLFIPMFLAMSYVGVAIPLMDGWWELTIAEVVSVFGFFVCLIFPLSGILDEGGNIVGSFSNYLGVVSRACERTFYVLALLVGVLVALTVFVISASGDVDGVYSENAMNAIHVSEDFDFFTVVFIMGMFCFFSIKEGRPS